MSDELRPIGEVTHYFDRIGVAVISLWAGLALGDWVQFYGSSTNFAQQIDSMQIDYQPIEEAVAGQEVAVLVSEKVRKGDKIYPYTSNNF